jgi:hypothetical protein
VGTTIFLPAFQAGSLIKWRNVPIGDAGAREIVDQCDRNFVSRYRGADIWVRSVDVWSKDGKQSAFVIAVFWI